MNVIIPTKIVIHYCINSMIETPFILQQLFGGFNISIIHKLILKKKYFQSHSFNKIIYI